MTKQEKIKQDWGQYYTKEVTEDGWLRIKSQVYANEDFYDRLKFNNHTHSIRPKSLSGIEDNNGWIKIESRDDLPKDRSVRYLTGYKHPDRKFKLHKRISNLRDLDMAYYAKCITHYKTIQKPELPIYYE